MAHSLSARKRVRQNEKRRNRNRLAKSRRRTMIRKFRSQVDAGELDEARTYFPTVAREIDLTSKKGIIHDRTASRYKSRLALLLNKQTAQ